MQLKDSLYTIVHADVESPMPRFHIRLHPDHTIYKAHFPEQPITPGVCLIQIACELLHQLTGKHLQIQKIKQVKFLAVVSPRDVSTVTYIFNKVSPPDADGAIKVQVTVADAQRDYTTLSMTCVPSLG